jgi:hypothetical protein
MIVTRKGRAGARPSISQVSLLEGGRARFSEPKLISPARVTEVLGLMTYPKGFIERPLHSLRFLIIQ